MTNNDKTVFQPEGKGTENEKTNETQKSEKNKKWKKVAIGGASAILLGAAAGGARAFATNLSTDDLVADDTQENLAEAQQSFERAFSAARQSAGHGSSFRWKGATFSTSTTEEWDKMPEEEQDEIAEQADTEMTDEEGVDANGEEITDSEMVDADEVVDEGEQEYAEGDNVTVTDEQADTNDPGLLGSILGTVVGKVTDKFTDKAGDVVDQVLDKILGTGGGTSEEEDVESTDNADEGEIELASNTMEMDTDESEIVEPIIDDFEGGEVVDAEEVDAEDVDVEKLDVEKVNADVAEEEVLMAEHITVEDGDDVYDVDAASNTSSFDAEEVEESEIEPTTVEELAEAVQEESAIDDDEIDTTYTAEDMADDGLVGPVADDDLTSI